MKPSILLTPLVHKNKKAIAIKFAYSYMVKEKVKVIKGVRWSATHGCFYVFEEIMTVNSLFNALRKAELYVDYSAFMKTTQKNLPDGINLKKNTTPIQVTVKQSRDISEKKKQVIRDFVLYLRGLRLSESTVKTYFTFVADFVAFHPTVPCDKLDNTHVRFFVEHQVKRRKYAISTHRQMVSAIKHFGTFLPGSLLEVDEIPRPSKSSYLPTILSKEELVDLLRFTKNLKHRSVLALLYSAGLRVGEVISLELRDIDVDRRQLIVKNGKGRKDRVTVLAESFLPLLQNYLTTYQPERFFIENPNGGQYTAGSIRSFLKRSCKEAGITKRVTPHTLRHSYATHLMENGVGLRHIQSLLGHAKPETTMIYTHVARKDILQITSPLDTALHALREQDKSNQKPWLSQNIGG